MDTDFASFFPDHWEREKGRDCSGYLLCAGHLIHHFSFAPHENGDNYLYFTDETPMVREVKPLDLGFLGVNLNASLMGRKFLSRLDNLLPPSPRET